MLEQIECIFDNTEAMLKKINKKTYEPRMKEFREQHGHYFKEMTDYVDCQEDKEKASQELADAFVSAVQNRFRKKRKIPGRTQVDMNFFMIYFVFPAILLTEHENAKDIADAICEKWGKTFKDSKIGYTTYEELNGAFRNKIFGIF